MDPRRKERIRECPDNPGDGLPTGEQFNALGMVLSLVALLMKYKLAGWLSVYCALMLLANAKAKDEKKSVFTLFLLSSSSLFMLYMQSPSPLSITW